MNCELRKRSGQRPWARRAKQTLRPQFTIYYCLFVILLVTCHSSLVTVLRGAENTVRYEASHESMGTVYTVAVYGRDRTFLSEVVEEVFEEVDRLDEQMSNYKPESELSAINREAASRPVVVEPGLFHLLEISIGRSEETGGAFDI